MRGFIVLKKDGRIPHTTTHLSLEKWVNHKRAFTGRGAAGFGKFGEEDLWIVEVVDGVRSGDYINCEMVRLVEKVPLKGIWSGAGSDSKGKLQVALKKIGYTLDG